MLLKAITSLLGIIKKTISDVTSSYLLYLKSKAKSRYAQINGFLKHIKNVRINVIFCKINV